MSEEIVTSLVDEMHVTEELARSAVLQADGELDKARSILDGMVARYLLIQASFVSLKSRDSGGGLIYLIAEKGASDFILFKPITNNE